MFYIVLILVLQMTYCSAYCNCPGNVVLPTYAIVLIGIIIATLFFATAALAFCVYRLKRGNIIDRSIFEKPKLSISKYERQLSGNSTRMIMRDSMNDDTAQLNANENVDDDDGNATIADQVKIETEPDRPPPKLAQKPKVPILPEDQIDRICKAVINSHRKKDFTSLSELDKIVSDAQEEKFKIFDTSASTPELDTLDEPTPIPVKKLPIFDANSKESKLRDEMMAMFKQDQFKSKLKSKNKLEANKDIIDSKDITKAINENQFDDGNKCKDEIDYKNNILTTDESKFKNDFNSEDDLQTKADQEKILCLESEDRTKLKPNLAEMNSKRINLEIMAKFNQGSLKSIVKDEDSKFFDDVSDPEDTHVSIDKINDNTPPRLLDDFYDILPSSKHSNDTYDTYDYPPSPKPSNDLYDFPPSPKPHNAVYDCVPERRNLIVSDGNTTGYLFPLTDSNLELFEGPQYSNAKSVPDKDIP